MRSLQNERSIFFEKNVSRRTVTCEGRLFCSFSSFMLPAIYQVQMERECLSVSMSLLGLSSAPSLLKKLMKISILVLWKLNVRPIIFLDNTSIMAWTKKEFIQERGHFNIPSTNFGFCDQQKQICVTSLPDFTVSRCGNKFRGNESLTSPGKEVQNYFTVPKHSKRKISLCKGDGTDVMTSLFYSHCSISGSSSVSKNSKTKDSRTCKY